MLAAPGARILKAAWSFPHATKRVFCLEYGLFIVPAVEKKDILLH